MRAILALEDGLAFEGRSFTGPGETSGEVIFNTGMTGYQEIVTDPSYAGQLVCMTYPLIGNYGVNPDDVESDCVRAEALICRECCKEPSNYRATESLPEYLSRHGVMGLEGVDTRALTRHLRLQGAKRGIISTSELDPERLAARAREIPHMEGRNLVGEVSTKAPYAWFGSGPEARPRPVEPAPDGTYSWPGGDRPRVVAYDFGVKWNILRQLSGQGLDILVVPSTFTAEQTRALAPDAVFLSNGPGDPAAMSAEIAEIARLAEDKIMAGICLGHQLLGHALGGETFKLKFGHHGCNHPVKELATGRIEISSQNHGFCVSMDSLADVTATHVNLNDHTVEGFEHSSRPIIAIQHHPEACPGPRDSKYFFGRFRELIRREAGK